MDFLGYNPLLSSVDVKLHADYAHPDSLSTISADLEENEMVKEVFYQESLVNLINRNIRRMGVVILVFCGMLSLVAIALINNTIRLSVYSKRFLIRSMQLVGATQGFIRKPFVINGVLRGIVGALVANGMLLGVILFIRREAPELFARQPLEITAILFSIVVLLGIVIS